MSESALAVVTLAGDAQAATLLAQRLCGAGVADPEGATFELGAHRYRLAGEPAASDPLAGLASRRHRSGPAVLAIDPDRGLTIEVRSAAYLLRLLGRTVVAVACDDRDGSEGFARIASECANYFDRIGLVSYAVIPLAATGPAATPAWHDGPSLAEALAAPPPSSDLPLRVSLGGGAGRRRGHVECGRLTVGDSFLLSPANLTAEVRALCDAETGATKENAEAGDAVEIALEPDVAPPGQLASRAEAPPVETDVFRARLFWAGLTPLKVGVGLLARLRGEAHPVTVQSIGRIVSTPDFAEQDGETAVAGDLVDCVLRLPEIVALDPFERCPPTGWLTLEDDQGAVAAAAIGMEGYADQRGLITVRATNVSRSGAAVSAEARETRNGHRGGVLWLTGLSGAGKSTIAAAAERRLFDKGYQVSVLDGDNLRHGLSADLGFSPEDRAENIRRIGEVGALFARAGMIAITAFISPYRSDRARARSAHPSGFAEIYVRADLATCEARDPKGLYKKARAGEIPEFTGISAPYEAPESPDLVIDTDRAGIEASVDLLVGYIETEFALTSAPRRE